MTGRNARLLIALGVLPLFGCATTTTNYKCPADPSHMPHVLLSEAFQMSSHQLACYGSELRVNCGLLHGIKEEDRAACRVYVSAVATYLSRDAGATLTPAPNMPVTFKDGGVCIDTFIPGREADDCFDYIQASIPLTLATGASAVVSPKSTRDR